MLRGILYRRIIAIALGAALLVALGLGLFMQLYFRASAAEELGRSFDDIQNRITLMNRMIAPPEAAMLARGRRALAELAGRGPATETLLAASSEALAAEAARLGVDELYVIDGKDLVAATSLPSDLGLDLSGYSADFTAFLDRLRGSGRIEDQGISISSRTGRVNTYQYLGLRGSSLILEVSCRFDAAFAAAYGGISFEDFVAYDFGPYMDSDPSGEVSSVDVLSVNGKGAWSLIRQGSRRDLDPAVVDKALAGGEALRVEGLRSFHYRPLVMATGRGFSDRIVAEICVDFTSRLRFGLLTLFIALTCCALAGLVSLFATKSFFDTSIVARVEGLVEAMGRVASGERGVSFESDSGDELSQIGKGIHSMLDEVRAAEEELRNARAAEAIGLMAGGLAHDINNLLAGAVGAATLIRSRLDEEGQVSAAELHASLDLIEKTGKRGESLVRDLLALARSDRPAPSRVDLAALAVEAAELIRGSSPSSVSVELDLPAEEPLVLASADDLRRVLLNLCRNGVQAMTDMRPPEQKKGGLLGIRISRGRGGSAWVVAIRDDGVGIPPDLLPRLFTPFLTTKNRKAGSGLGLAASKALVEAQGGRLEVESEPGRGSTFSLVFAALQEAAPSS
jgi:signal transduction histidine kinase